MTTLIKVNVDKEIKEDAVAKREEIPFEITNLKPSKQLLKALAEEKEMEKNPDKYPSYNNLEDLRKALLADD